VCIKINQESRGWIGGNQHEEIVRCVAHYGELILDVVLCIKHVCRCTEDILLYRFSCKVFICGGLFSQGGRPVNPQGTIICTFCIY
jgi:hypothetical protein